MCKAIRTVLHNDSKIVERCKTIHTVVQNDLKNTEIRIPIVAPAQNQRSNGNPRDPIRGCGAKLFSKGAKRFDFARALVIFAGLAFT